MISRWIDEVRAGHSLSESDASECLRTILGGEVPDDLIAKLLVGLAEKGETVDEIVGFCRVLQESWLDLPLGEDCIDICGTGGSGLSRFNVSTSVAFLLAADGIRVAKHGNRGSLLSNGSFDLLDALGCPFELPPLRAAELFERTGLCFVFARQYHPAMKAVVNARKLANRRTIFNLAGPLSNPANPSFQVVGTPTQTNAKLIAEVLRRLGRSRSLVVTGAPGIDEVSVSGETEILDMTPDNISAMTLRPAEFGIDPVAYETVPGGDSEENKVLFEQLITGSAPDSIVDTVSLSAAVAMYCRGETESVSDGYRRSRTLLSDGDVARKFNEFVSISRELTS